MLTLLALVLSQTPQHMLFRQPNLPQSAGAFFEAFPSSGAGTSGVCSTTAPTGAKGETLTVTRATSAMCQSTAAGGMVSSGIANGELTLLSSGVARQEFDRQGVLGVRVEGARTNSDQRSEEIDNAWWGNATTGVANPVLNGTCAASPLASPTSAPEDYTFAATAAGQQSGRLGTVVAAFAAVAAAHTGLVCGVNGSGSLDICAWNTTTPTCSTCNFPACSSGWARCERVATSSGNVATFFGNNTLYNGGTARSSNRVCVTAAQGEIGGFATSYIPTTGAAATRNADVVSFPVTLTGGTFSAGISYDTPSTLATGMTAFQVYVDANNSVTAALDASNKLVCTFRIGGSDSTVTTAAAVTAGAVNRVACTYGASGRSACLNGTCTTTAGALTMPTGAATFYGGTRSATGNEANGVLSRWCYEFASDARCVL